MSISYAQVSVGLCTRKMCTEVDVVLIIKVKIWEYLNNFSFFLNFPHLPAKCTTTGSFITCSLVQGTWSIKTKPEAEMRESEREDIYLDESVT